MSPDPRRADGRPRRAQGPQRRPVHPGQRVRPDRRRPHASRPARRSASSASPDAASRRWRRCWWACSRPTSGTVSFRGRDLWSMGPPKRRAAIGGKHRHDLPGPVDGPEPPAARPPDPAGPAGRARARGSAREREERVRELMSLVGLPRALADAPARPAVRRPAPTGRHRTGVGAGPGPGGRRRADQRAGRLGPRPDPQPSPGPEGAPGSGPGLRLARHPDGTADERPGDHDVPGPDRGGVPGGRGDRQGAAPVHAGAVLGDAGPAATRSTRSRWSARCPRRRVRPPAARSAPAAGRRATCARRRCRSSRPRQSRDTVSVAITLWRRAGRPGNWSPRRWPPCPTWPLTCGKPHHPP